MQDACKYGHLGPQNILGTTFFILVSILSHPYLDGLEQWLMIRQVALVRLQALEQAANMVYFFARLMESDMSVWAVDWNRTFFVLLYGDYKNVPFALHLVASLR